MSISIGTNFYLESEQFLDNRQNLPKTIQDLREWDITVPSGFEVPVDGVWYTYNPDYDSPETGHWKRRIESDLAGSGLEKLIKSQEKDIVGIKNIVFPVEVYDITPVKINLLGTTDLPEITWTLRRYGKEVTPERSWINGEETRDPGSYQEFDLISEDTEYNLKSMYEGITVTAKTKVVFRNLVFIGTSENPELDPDSWGTELSQEFEGDNLGRPESVFDCTGGKYVYYVFPSRKYDSSRFRAWIGGLEVQDFIVTEIPGWRNSVGHSEEYTVLRLRNLQNGVLRIKFEDEQ